MGEDYVGGTVSEAAAASPFSVEGGADSLEVVSDMVIDYGPRLEALQEGLTAIQEHMSRPLMTTPFEEYTVGEGLVLLLLMFLILQSLVKLVKEGFSWLLW